MVTVLAIIGAVALAVVACFACLFYAGTRAFNGEE